VDGWSGDFASLSDDDLASFIRRAEMDIGLSRNDPDRKRRIGAVLDAALAERWLRLESRDIAAPS
jgi:hypothetical protein